MTNDQYNIAFIALGSNEGDKLNNLKKAVEEIKKNSDCMIKKSSSIYETKPFGNVKQDNFLNAAIKIQTKLELLELFLFLKKAEKKLGRIKTIKWGPRKIDLDLLFFNKIIYSDKNITVPHKGIPFRDFVLVPLCEIEPDLKHPELNEKICEIAVKVSEKNIICKFDQKLIEIGKS